MSTGFSGAPVAKLVFFASCATSLLQQASRLHIASLGWLWRPIARLFAFRHPGEAVFGLILQYNFRIFEGQIGSAKFGAYALASLGFGQLVQLCLGQLFALKSAPGPHTFIFASFVEYTLSIPPSQHFELLGWRLTDKVFVYLLTLQLFLSSVRTSGLSCFAGLIFGIAYWAAPLGLQKLKIPAAVAQWLQGRAQQQNRMTQQAQPSGAGAASHSQPAAAQVPAASAPQLPEVSEEALEQMVAMGFDRAAAAQALQQNQNDVSAALAFLV